MLVALCTLAIQQQFTNPVQEIWLGGQREVLLGLSPVKSTTLGFYTFKKWWTMDEAFQIRWLEVKDELRAGHVTYQTSKTELDGKPCFLFETEGLRAQNLGLAKNRLDRNEHTVVLATTGRGRKSWVSLDGKVLKQTYTDVLPHGMFYCEANFNGDDTISLILRSAAGERKMVLHPEGGTKLFDNEFKPMMDGSSVVLREKEFATLEAEHGAVKRWKARYVSPFYGHIATVKHEGHVVEISGDKKQSMKAYVTGASGLLQVEFSDKTSAMAEMVGGKWRIRGPHGIGG